MAARHRDEAVTYVAKKYSEPSPSEVAHRTRIATCPNRASHIEGPEGYLAMVDWAEQMLKTHDQSKCRGCGLYLIWTPKPR